MQIEVYELLKNDGEKYNSSYVICLSPINKTSESIKKQKGRRDEFIYNQ